MVNQNTGSRLAFQIPTINSIFSAEAIALLVAIKFYAKEKGNYFFITDAKSVLMALNNVHRKSVAIITRLRNEVNMRRSENYGITFIWVPGHKGIEINEVADNLAKHGPFGNVWIPWFSPEDWITDIKNCKNKESHWEWEHYCKDNRERCWYYDNIGYPHHIL